MPGSAGHARSALCGMAEEGESSRPTSSASASATIMRGTSGMNASCRRAVRNGSSASWRPFGGRAGGGVQPLGEGGGLVGWRPTNPGVCCVLSVLRGLSVTHCGGEHLWVSACVHLRSGICGPHTHPVSCEASHCDLVCWAFAPPQNSSGASLYFLKTYTHTVFGVKTCPHFTLLAVGNARGG